MNTITSIFAVGALIAFVVAAKPLHLLAARAGQMVRAKTNGSFDF